jgi:hypothetical protein
MVDGQSMSMSLCLVHAALEGLYLNESDIKAKFLLLPLGGLHVKHCSAA